MHPSPLEIDAWLWEAWLAYWMIAAFFANRSKVQENHLIRLTHSLPLLAGFVLMFHIGFDGSLIHDRFFNSLTIRRAGIAPTALGLLFSVWARVHLGRYWSGIITLKEGHKLIRTGPYRFVRHPIYTGLLIAALGSAISAATGDAFIGFALILISIFFKSRREETLLTGEFGEEYLRFKREVPGLCPLIY